MVEQSAAAAAAAFPATTPDAAASSVPTAAADADRSAGPPEWLRLWGTRLSYGLLGGAVWGVRVGLARARTPQVHATPVGVPATPAGRMSYFVTQAIVVQSARVGFFVALYSAVELLVRERLFAQRVAATTTASTASATPHLLGDAAVGTAGGAVTALCFAWRRYTVRGIAAGMLLGALLGGSLGGMGSAVQRLEHGLHNELEAAIQRRSDKSTAQSGEHIDGDDDEVPRAGRMDRWIHALERQADAADQYARQRQQPPPDAPKR
ncbi:hypothetical protein CDCA_CDCA17G4385 [Cyanidium caldarium]|uniref:Uncharacterized protein n=1 Tax=Cyanidium caldarium TaxID=2771 RepID=A0AAV9J202_CYACA|nr:hypothetical protein CDCA_CDCA17G4385 [Cyanidium caldarium]|eukprot:ctg_285.g197